MANLMLPSRRVCQPQQPAGINPGVIRHPSLFYAMQPIGGKWAVSRANACKMLAWEYGASTNSVLHTAKGSALAATALNTGLYAASAANWGFGLPSQGAATFGCIVHVIQATPTNAVVFGCSAPGAQAIPANYEKYIYLSSAGDFTLAFHIDVTLTYPATLGYHVLVGRLTGSTVDFFVDGVLVASGTTASTNFSSMGFYPVKYSSTGVTTSAQSNGGAVLGIANWMYKGVSDAEIKQFSANPWQVYAPRPKRLWRGSAAQIHALTGSDAAQANSSDSGSVIQTRLLSGDNATQAASAGSGAIAQTHLLDGNPVTQANQSDSGSVIQTRLVGGDNATQAASAGSGAIAQTHLLDGNNATQANDSSSGAVTSGMEHTLSGDSVTQSNASSTGEIGQTHVLGASPSVQNNAGSSGAVTQTHLLDAAGSTQANHSSTAGITLPADIKHYRLIGGAAIALTRLSTSVVAAGWGLDSTVTRMTVLKTEARYAA